MSMWNWTIDLGRVFNIIKMFNSLHWNANDYEQSITADDSSGNELFFAAECMHDAPRDGSKAHSPQGCVVHSLRHFQPYRQKDERTQPTMKKHSATLRFSQVFSFLLKTLFVLSLLISASLPVSAEDHTENDTVHNGKGSEHIKSVTLSYGGVEKDVWNDIFTVDNGTDAPMNLHFEYDDWLAPQAMVIEVSSITQDGQETRLGDAMGGGVCDTYAGNSYDLPADCGIRVRVWDWNEVIVDAMLGIIVKQNEARQLFESVDMSFGPKEGVAIDMSSFMPKAGFEINVIPMPCTYKHFPDGHSVLGIGWNSSEQGFWEKASRGEFTSLAHGKVYESWEDEKSKHERGSLGLVWSVGGYAVSYDDNPRKMGGQLQFYLGSGIEQAGQYSVFTYSITITLGVQGLVQFTVEPEGKTPFEVDLQLGFLSGLELYGGIGIGCLLSAGIYGSATFMANFQFMPVQQAKDCYLDGEVGLKAKLFGRTIFKFKFTEGRLDFKEGKIKDGKQTLTLPDTVNVQERMNNEIENLVASGYANQIYEVNETSGETIWHTQNLDQPDEDHAKLYAGSDGHMLGDRSFSTKLADNIHPENGIQIKNLYEGEHDTALILLVGNNDSREPGKKGELLYSIYHHDTKYITEPKPVVLDIDEDHIEDTGGDFSPRLTRGPEYDSLYATWLRGTDAQSANLTLRDAVSDMQLCFAKYDVEFNRWTNFEIVSKSNEYLLGGSAVGYAKSEALYPHVFAYTNPEEDPAGLSENSEHDILVFEYNPEGGYWEPEVIDHVAGRIIRFDGGQYYFSENSAVMPAAAYSVEASGSKTVNVISDGGIKRTFSNAWNGAFANTDGTVTLTFMRDGALYTANGTNNDNADQIFPQSDKEGMPEATYQLIGDLNGSNVIGYLKSEGTSQNLSGYARISSASTEYGRTDITDVPENTNVNYFDGVFVGDDEPVIVYSTQEYSAANGEFVDGVSNLYIQVGAENTHVSLTNAELDNARELDGNTHAEISVEFRNNGLVPIDYVDVYARKVIKPEIFALRVQNVQNTVSSEYISLGRQNLEKLLPGHTDVITVTIPDTMADEPEYTIALIGSSSKYPKEEIQTEIPVDLSAGITVISDTDYDYRYSKDNDSYTVEIKGYGIKPRSGKVVFYNSETLEVYGEESFSGLKLGSTTTFDFGKLGAPLRDKCPNLGVRVLEGEEVVDEDQPAEKYRPLKTLPEWYYKYWDVEELNNPDEDTPADPTPSPEPTPAPKPAPSDQSGNNQNTSSANTADSSNAGIYAGVLTVSAILSLILIYERRKRASN